MSELAVAAALTSDGHLYEYEKPLKLGGYTRYPDFTVDDQISGRKVCWQHLGMLEHDGYRRSWEHKRASYRANGVLPDSQGGGLEGTLVTSLGSGLTGFDLPTIKATVARVLGG